MVWIFMSFLADQVMWNIINYYKILQYFITFLSFLIRFYLGFNVAHRRRKPGKIGKNHQLTKDDAMKWFQQRYDGIILGKKST